MNIWQLQQAKAQLSEVVRLCILKGPQFLTVRGKQEAVIMSKKEYEKLIGRKPSFIEYLQSSPLKGVELNLERDQSIDREIDL